MGCLPADREQCWMNHRWQLLVPISADILRSLTWTKKHFFNFKKSPIKKKKKCLDFFFQVFFHCFSPPLSWVCSSLVIFLLYLLHSFHSFFLLLLFPFNPAVLYKKQTGPTSTPNSWSAPPTSRGAMSTMGRREVFCDRYSITVLPHCPVCFCAACRKENGKRRQEPLDHLLTCWEIECRTKMTVVRRNKTPWNYFTLWFFRSVQDEVDCTGGPGGSV